jgi:prepilin-type N-terminal cleavage/methylation domain-containing protein
MPITKPAVHRLATAQTAQRGSTLPELMIAVLVLSVGLLGGMGLVMNAISGNNRSKLDSTSTILSQMTLEAIASVPANATSSSTPSSNATIVDCNPTSSSATHAVNTLGVAGSGAGAPLTSGGAIDWSQAAVSGYDLLFYNCQASTGDRQLIYEVRWNVTTLTSNAKLVTVATRLQGTQTGNLAFFAIPVSLKTIVGL